MAEQHRRYKKDPLTEAVIDLRVELPEGTHVEDLRGLHARLSDTYGAPQEMYENVATIEFRPGGSAPLARTAHARRGFRFDRADARRVMQARLDGFSYSAIAPYEEWETFRGEAKNLWELYRNAYHPIHVTRVAVRYINRIDIPLHAANSNGALQLKDYFSTYPQVADGLAHNTMAGFIMQIHVPQPDIDSTLLVNQAVVPPPHPGVFSVVLDLDLFREVQWDPTDDETVWGFLDILRVRKNDAFEASITDNTRELFN
ncbi:MAG: TIGR04255 family protein [Dehalococcoidia bacterium]